MNKLISAIKGFSKARYAILAIAALAVVSVGVSSGAQPAKSDTCTQISVPTTPAFNVWPLTYDNSVACHDLPLIDVADPSAGGRDARYAQSQGEHSAGINANVGDTVSVSIYFHNGATPDASLVNQTTAHNVTVSTSFNADASTSHTFSGTISTSNGQGASSDSSRGGSITVHTSVPTTIQYVAGSTQLTGGSGNRSLPDGVANGSVNIGDIKACWNYSGTVLFKVKVVAVQSTNPTASISLNPNPIKVCTGTLGTTTVTSSANVEYYIYVNGPSSAAGGTIFAGHLGDGQTYTDATGNWVYEGDTFYLVAKTGGPALAQVTAHITTAGCSNPVTPTGTISLNPNPIQVCTGTYGTTNVTSSANVDYDVYTVVPYANGSNHFEQLAGDGKSTTKATGNWVNDGAMFYLVSHSTGAVLAQVTAHTTTAGCTTPPNNPTPTGTISLNPNPIQVCTGTYGTTNVTSSANVDYDIYTVVPQANGTNHFEQLAGDGKSTTKATGNWVYDGAVFYLVSHSTGAVLAQVTAHTTTAGCSNPVTPTGSISLNPNPIKVCTGTYGTTTVTSSANVDYDIYTVVPQANGTNHFAQYAGDGNVNTKSTGNWVYDGAVFYLVSHSTGAVLAQVTAHTTTAGCTTPGTAQLSITKLVQDQNYATGYSKNVNSYPGDRIQFKISVKNIGTATATGVTLTDAIPSGLSYLSGTTTVDGTTVSDISNGNVSLGDMTVNQTHDIVFVTTVSTGSTASATIQNTASAVATNAYSVQDTASVFVQSSGTVNLVQSKSAYNNTRGVNATSVAAQSGDSITYTLTVANNGSVAANSYVITDDLSNVLQFSSVSAANGGTMNGSAISWPSVSIPAGSSVQKTFQVTVNANTTYSGTLQMVNTYGNTVTITITGVQQNPVTPTYYPPTYYGPTYYGPTYNAPTYYAPTYYPPTYVQTAAYVQPQTIVVPQQPLLQVQPQVVQQQPQVLGATFVAPKTGADSETAVAFAGFVTTGIAALRKRSWFMAIFRK